MAGEIQIIKVKNLVFSQNGMVITTDYDAPGFSICLGLNQYATFKKFHCNQDGIIYLISKISSEPALSLYSEVQLTSSPA